MTNCNGMKIKRSDSAISRVIDGEFVVLVPDEGMIHALKGCGSRVWELIQGETSIADIVQKICAEYDVEPQRAEQEIDQFVNKLVAMKILEAVPVKSKEVVV